jgi:hypothetical protein
MWLIEREKVGSDRGWATNHPGLGVWSHRQVEPSHGQISGRAGHTEGVNTGLKGKAVGSDWLTNAVRRGRMALDMGQSTSRPPYSGAHFFELPSGPKLLT